MRIRILIADDHVVVRQGIKTILNSLGEQHHVVAEAEDGREVMQLMDIHDVDVTILDISMPKLNGLETTRRLLKQRPQVKVVILSMFDDRISVEKALAYGASGYLVKDSAIEEVGQAIDAVYRGETYLSPSVAKYRQTFYHGMKNDYGRTETVINLTDKEREVLQLLAEGFTSKEIAVELNITFNTVNVHRKHIMKKLNIHKSADLVRYAIKEGIIRS